ncbi:cache domain-containing protein [soil metagenome]
MISGGEQSGPTTAADVRAAVTAVVESTFDSLNRIAGAMTAVWDVLEDRRTTPRSADLAGLRGVVFAELNVHRTLFHGAGVVVAEGLLTDQPRYLEWWRNDSRRGGPAQPLQLDLNPGSEYFYDYTSMQWFTTPRDDGTRTVHGPYLDFTGVDLTICTFAVPVRSQHGRFLGIAGADVPVASIDAILIPAFRASGAPLALINAEGRVIAANDPEHLPGSRLRHGVPGLRHPVPGTPWTLVALSSDRRPWSPAADR